MIELGILFNLSCFTISLEDLMILLVLPLYLFIKYLFDKGNTKESVTEKKQSSNDSTSDSSPKPQ